MITREDIFGVEPISLSQFSGANTDRKKEALDEIINIGVVWANWASGNRKAMKSLVLDDGVKISKRDLKNHLKMAPKYVKPSGFLMTLLWPIIINQIISYVANMIINYLAKESTKSS